MPTDRPISNECEIHAWMHCVRCLAERPYDTSPAEWSRLDVGWTPIGLQVWCRRHDDNVLHVDFEGQQHPANTASREKKATAKGARTKKAAEKKRSSPSAKKKAKPRGTRA